MKDILNYHQMTGSIATGGQPTGGQPAQVADAGYSVIVKLELDEIEQ